MRFLVSLLFVLLAFGLLGPAPVAADDAVLPYHDAPLVGDFDGNGILDLAMWLEDGSWRITLNGTLLGLPFHLDRFKAFWFGSRATDVALIGDYDG